ncbi:MAG: hypothetical protein IJT73_01690 [Selenomonadaceae bacterium]|nr:hypothetical protein [Selenomonadaceae bacterium]
MQYTGTVKNCCAQAQVSGGYRRGVIVGNNYQANAFENNCYYVSGSTQGKGDNINAAKLVILGKTADFEGVTISGDTYTLGGSYGTGIGTALTFTVTGNSYIENAEKTEYIIYIYTVAKNSLPKFWEIKTLWAVARLATTLL